jgi:hypothetical protein
MADIIVTTKGVATPAVPIDPHIAGVGVVAVQLRRWVQWTDNATECRSRSLTTATTTAAAATDKQTQLTQRHAVWPDGYSASAETNYGPKCLVNDCKTVTHVVATSPDHTTSLVPTTTATQCSRIIIGKHIMESECSSPYSQRPTTAHCTHSKVMAQHLCLWDEKWMWDYGMESWRHWTACEIQTYVGG